MITVCIEENKAVYEQSLKKEHNGFWYQSVASVVENYEEIDKIIAFEMPIHFMFIIDMEEKDVKKTLQDFVSLQKFIKH